VLWLANDSPYWPSFNAPLIQAGGLPVVYPVDLIEILSLQMVMSMLVHISLIFPEHRPIFKRHPWLPVPLYVLSIAFPLIAMLISDGSLLNRMATVYPPRLWINTGLLILATIIMLISYRQCESPAQRERARWIIVAMTIVATTHVIFWNLPTLFLGEPLVPNYNWMLALVALIPLALTVAITNHELFGVIGIIRGRMKLVQARLQKEQSMVMRRDQRMREMTQELDQLTAELQEYVRAERAGEGPADPTPKLSKLEERFPQLRQIRNETLIGASPHWEKVFEQAAVAARGTAPVMIAGESGTGTTHVAQAAHLLSDRSDRICKEISCAQFEHADPTFALGKLFGVGTGHGLPNVPKEGQSGLLEESDGGTLFLDDFDRLPLNVQDLLLYPLEGKPFEPGIGRGKPRTVSVKFIFATKRDPAQLVSEGKFQADVLARIGTRVAVPPLRERSEDIPLLVEHFTHKLGKELQHDISVVSPKAMHLLSRYSYARGNARELMSEIHKAIGKAMLEDDNVLRAGYLSEELWVATSPRRDSVVPVQTEPAEPSIATRAVTETAEPAGLTALRKHRFQIKPAEEELGLSHKSRTLSNHLRGLCIKALSENGWDLGQAARSLCDSDDPKILTRIEGKMRRYLKNIEDNVGKHFERKLYNNLPAAYHEPLAKAIRWARTQRQAP
jgi:transcriptional regulator with AAA-type ATPase domain